MKQVARSPALAALDVLVGDWDNIANFDGTPMGGVRTSFHWTDDGLFLRQYADMAPSESGTEPEPMPSSPLPVTTLIGLDDTSDQFTMLYADARGVFRVYQMSLRDGVWKQWRDAPGFAQRFTGTFSDDGRTITGSWELSEDGSNWKHDFDMSSFKRM